jgi:uncharacterized phage protein gp47/JayE
MALDRPTLSEITTRIAADIKDKIQGATTLATRSVLQVLARVLAGAIHLLYGYADNVWRQLFATLASGTWLDLIGSELGVPRNAATESTGTITITGTAATVIPLGTLLRDSDGYRYDTDAEATIGAGGSITADVTAELGGEDYNNSAGTVLTFVSPIVGVDSTATVGSDGLTGGADEETDAAYRTRILARKRDVPHGGAAHDLEQWTLEVSGNTRAWAVEQYQGVGTVAVFYVRDNDSGGIFPSSSEIATTRAYLVSHTGRNGQLEGIPVTMEPGLFVLAPEALTVDFTISVYPNNSSVRTNITNELTDLILTEGGPGETIYLSQIGEAISRAAGEERHEVSVPAADVTAASNQVHVLGTITFGTLS